MKDSNLLSLINSLKSNEKQHVTFYLSKNKKNSNLLKLYRILREGKTTTNAAITERSTDRRFISRLSQNKYELFQLILDAMHHFELRKSPYGRILVMLHQSEILLNKGLVEARKELLAKAGLLAEKYELFELKLEVTRLQNIGFFNEAVSAALLKETKKVTAKILNGVQVKHYYNKVNLLFLNKGNRLTSSQRLYLTKLSHVFNRRKFAMETFFNKFCKSMFWESYYFVTGKRKKSHEICFKILRLFKQNSGLLQIQIWRNRYLTVYIDLIRSWHNMDALTSLEILYHEFREFDGSGYLKSVLDINILHFFIQSGMFRQGEELLNRIQRNLPNALVAQNRFPLLANLAIMNFGLDNYSKSLFWLNELLNHSKSDLSEFPYSGIMRLFRLIVYYELRSFDAIEYDFRSASSTIDRNEKMFKSETLILQCILKMVSINNHFELKGVMEQTLEQLKVQSNKISEAEVAGIFDFISWFESKIQGKSYAGIIREKEVKN